MADAKQPQDPFEMFRKLWARLSAAFLFVVLVAVLGITLVNIRSVLERQTADVFFK